MSEVKPIRLGIMGCAGTGKSSLAEAISKALNVPFLKSRDITQTVLTRGGYDYSSGIQIERFLANTVYQNEILRKTMEQQSVPQFVTDRTVVDLAAYALCEMREDSDTVKNIFETCKKRVVMYSHLLLCPWQDNLTDNGRRTLNPWYQLLIHTIERGILDDWKCGYHVMEAVNEDRAQEALTFLRKA
jgi:predicted ATPase